jgi:hypothetical protein
MMDMDDVNSKPIDIKVIEYYLYDNVLWDALSFNRRDYYDLWALSIIPFITSCWHFPNYDSVIPGMKEYVTKKLYNMKPNELLTCISAFNGFAIYRKDQFINCHYDWSVQKNVGMFSKEQIEMNEMSVGMKMTMNKSYHPIIGPTTDCEHRHFHTMAFQNGSRICISPRYLFIE